VYFLINFHSNNEATEDTKKKTKPLTGLQAKVALVALNGDTTLAELSSQYDVHVNQIQTWCT